MIKHSVAFHLPLVKLPVWLSSGDWCERSCLAPILGVSRRTYLGLYTHFGAALQAIVTMVGLSGALKALACVLALTLGKEGWYNSQSPYFLHALLLRKTLLRRQSIFVKQKDKIRTICLAGVVTSLWLLSFQSPQATSWRQGLSVLTIPSITVSVTLPISP